MIRRWWRERRLMREHRWTTAHLSAYLDGELAATERARVEEHAGFCPECRRLLRTLRRTLEGLMGLRVPPSEGVAERVIDRLAQRALTPGCPGRPRRSTGTASTLARAGRR